MNPVHRFLPRKPDAGNVWAVNVWGTSPSWPSCITPWCCSWDWISHINYPPPVPVIVLPHMDSTNVFADVVPPLRPAGGSARRPLSRIATQTGIRPTMDLTESPESELPPRELPQVSPRPPPSYSPPVDSGLRRQSIRRGTHDAPPSALEERVPPRPPSIPTVAMPHPSGPIPPTPDPTGPQRLFPDDGVTGCPPTRPPRHGSSLDYSTGDYPYRFDTMPSPARTPVHPIINLPTYLAVSTRPFGPP